MDIFLLEKIVYSSPVGFNRLHFIVRSEIKSTRTLSKKLKELQDEGYITWEKVELKGRGHESRIYASNQAINELKIREESEKVLNDYFLKNPKEKNGQNEHSRVFRNFMKDEPLKMLQMLDYLSSRFNQQTGILEQAEKVRLGERNYIPFSKEEMNKLIIEATKARKSFREYVKMKLFS